MVMIMGRSGELATDGEAYSASAEYCQGGPNRIYRIDKRRVSRHHRRSLHASQFFVCHKNLRGCAGLLQPDELAHGFDTNDGKDLPPGQERDAVGDRDFARMATRL